MFDILFPFAFVIASGAVCRRLRIGGLDAESLRQAIGASVFNIFLPALCVKITLTTTIDMETFLIPLTACVATVTGLLLSIGVYTFLGKALHITQAQKGVLIIAATFGNVTYLGLPVLTGLFGSEAAKYALFYDLLATTPLLWLVGAPLALRYGEGKRYKIRTSLREIGTLPPLWGICTGILIKLTGLPFPPVVLKTMSMLGDLVVPLMIFSIGLALSLPKVKHAYALAPAIIIKLAIVPFISYLTASILGLRATALASCLIEGAMPTMVLSLLIAERFKLDESLAAFLIVVTTLLSFATLPFTSHLTKFLVP
ncbi:MAG: AEC family transporter [Thermodesulfovibrionales bacterium]|jgi:predicted permease